MGTQKALDSHNITDKVKLLSFLWLKANMLTFVFSYHDWWRHPLSCMSVMLLLDLFLFFRAIFCDEVSVN